MPNSIAEALEAAYDKHSEDEDVTDAPVSEGVETTPEPEPESAEGVGTDDTVAGEGSGNSEPEASGEITESTAGADTAKPSEDDDTPGADTGDGAGVDEPIQAAPLKEKAPLGWTPEARKAFATLPAPVRAAVVKREQDINRKLEQQAPRVKYAAAMDEVVGPYRGLYQAAGADERQAVANALKAQAMLHTGTPAQKAQLVAQLVGQYGISPADLADALEGKELPESPTQAINQLLQQELAPVKDYITRQQEQVHQSTMAEQEKAVIAWAKEKPYFDELRNDMADVVDQAVKLGQQVTLDEAYRMALISRPEVAKAIEDDNAAAREAEFQRKREAATTLKPGHSAPRPADTGLGIPSGASIDQAVAAAFKLHSED